MEANKTFTIYAEKNSSKIQIYVCAYESVQAFFTS